MGRIGEWDGEGGGGRIGEWDGEGEDWMWRGGRMKSSNGDVEGKEGGQSWDVGGGEGGVWRCPCIYAYKHGH